MKEILFTEPVLREMLWGGNRLSEFGYRLPSERVGECWGISAHPGGDCRIKNGTYKGRHLSELYKEKPELFGNTGSDRFPLLVKIIDARDKLSIQVHPDDRYAFVNEHGSFGKNECWYILCCEEGASVVLGHNAQTMAEAKRMVSEGRYDEFLRTVQVHPGDFFQINPGMIHAINGGVMLLETQQSSDVTYRFYDYGRLQNGKPRELHVDKALAVMQCPYREAEVKPNTEQVGDAEITHFTSNAYFHVDRIRLSGHTEIADAPCFRNMSVIEGSGTVNGLPFQKGDHFIVPARFGTLSLSGEAVLIASTVPEKTKKQSVKKERKQP